MSYRRRWWHVPEPSRYALRRNAKRLAGFLVKNAGECERCRDHAYNMARLATADDVLQHYHLYRLAFFHWHFRMPASTWERPDPNANGGSEGG